MGKAKRDLGVDQNGVQKMMRKRDYLADMSGQFGMNLVANLIGQLTYFYTDKVGLAVGGVGVAMLIAKIVDAVTDLWFGNVVRPFKGREQRILPLDIEDDDPILHSCGFAVLCSDSGGAGSWH